MNYKGVKDKIYKCLGCDSNFTRDYYQSSTPKYCSISCQHTHRMNESVIKFGDGLISTSEAQRRILAELFGYKCSICEVSEWLNKPIMLQVDHIDGNPDNNLGTNLRLLCPNCHSQTPTYKGGNKKNPKADRRSTRNRAAYEKKVVRALGFEPRSRPL